MRNGPLLLLSVLVLAVVAAVAVASCSRRAPDGPAAMRSHDILLVSRDAGTATSPGDATSRAVRVEVVWRDEDRQRGLSGRTSLAEDAGMLFVYKDDRPRSFWMKDCHIGLDIAYLDAAGVVVTLATLPPGVGAAPGEIPQAPSVKPCRYVLEVTAGWFGRRGLGEGARVDLAGVTAGIVPE